MTNKKLFFSFFMITLIILCSSYFHSGFSKEDGSPSGKTGSPGDDGETCAQVDCHTGTANPIEGLLTSNIPETGYLSTDTFEFTISIEFPGRSTFGFQVSPQTLEGGKMGKLIIEDDFQTKTTGSGKYITHEKEGINGSDGKSWTFLWTPTTATGDVTFYYAVNAADGDEEPTGDSIYFGSFIVFEDPENLPLAIPENLQADVFHIQNPVANNLHIISGPQVEEYSFELFDINGTLVYTSANKLSGNHIEPMHTFSNGIYFIKLLYGGQFYFARFVKAS
ncbi:MAG: T9SS type A sorting domain-containing protein [Fimbriimonadaceae bacterium]|nr:T9SS type A sorting domain-containing protein [Chitinophagales bacterium]